MAIDTTAIYTALISSISHSIGSQLSQQQRPGDDSTSPIIFKNRPNPEYAVPEYPYAIIDITDIRDTDWYLTNLTFNTDLQQWQYETHKTLDILIKILGKDSLMLAEELATSYRRDDMITLLAEANIAIADVQAVNISPELLQTDFLEVGMVQMSIRVSDIYSDPSLESIENVILDGELDNTVNSNPLEIHIDTTQE